MQLSLRRFWMATAIGCLCVLMSIPRAWAAANQNIVLSQGWQFAQATDAKGAPVPEKWMPASVPGNAVLDLLQNKKIPKPFYRDNEAKLQWIEKASWKYRTTISLNPSVHNRRNIDLVFDGLDTCAQVYLNGSLVLTSDNMFRTYRINAKPYLKQGANKLLVVFPNQIECAAKIAAKDPWRPQTHLLEKTYIRKAAYEYGWDWGPRFVLSGIWKPVYLEAWNTARISNLYIHQLDVSKSVAHVTAQVGVMASADLPATVDVSYMIDGHTVHASSQTALHPGLNRVDVPFTIPNPRRWYPAGYGAQPLYSFHADIRAGGAIQDTRDARAGLRSAVLRQKPDQWGRSFEFVVNGIPIFAKGANVIPFDSFPSRVPESQLRDVLQSAKDANMNMVRVWGGGYYETRGFYDLCDQLGIMVWQDFMFANPWQSGTYEFKQNVKAEVTDQLKRLRNHPSIVLWNGNNERENNFPQNTANVSPLARLTLYQDYLTVFSGIIPTLVARYSPGTAYWPSSPSSNYAQTKELNSMVLTDGDDVGGSEHFGDTHDYTIWESLPTTPRRPFSSELDHHYRFVSEYGFQGFPDMRTIESYSLPEDRTSLATPVMAAHEKGIGAYNIIRDYIQQYYGQPKNFRSMVYASQIVQAEFTKLVAEHLRRDRPRTMGSLFWQLNDCWPVVSLSSVDYYGRWKALQYYARRFYAPLLVSPIVKDGVLSVYVVSDKTEPVEATLRVRIMKFDGGVVSEKTLPVTLPPLSSQSYLQIPEDSFSHEPGVAPAKTFAAMDLTVDGKKVSTNLIYFVPVPQVHLPADRLTSDITSSNGRYNLHISSAVLARDVHISFGDTDAKVSDNYFDLVPGESRDIQISSKASLSDLKKNMQIMTLADAFVKPGEKGFTWK